MIFLRFRNRRNTERIFLMSLLSSLMMVTSGPYKQKKEGTFTFLRKKAGFQTPRIAAVARVIKCLEVYL